MNLNLAIFKNIFSGRVVLFPILAIIIFFSAADFANAKVEHVDADVLKIIGDLKKYKCGEEDEPEGKTSFVNNIVEYMDEIIKKSVESKGIFKIQKDLSKATTAILTIYIVVLAIRFMFGGVQTPKVK